MSNPDAVYEEHRPELARLAYRMLGSRADADDVLQEGYLRWTRADRSDVRTPRPYLFSMMTRLCIDQRRAIDARKETYVGPWLPEPIVELEATAAPDRLEAAEDISMAFLVVMESLSPVERAAYLLRRVFDYDYQEIAAVVEKSEANCRQLVSRAEERVRERRPRYHPQPGEAERVAAAFLSACSSGDMDGLLAVLAGDAASYSDGGGKVFAAGEPIEGPERVARFFLGLWKKALVGKELRPARVNGQPGLLVYEAGELRNVMTFEIVDGRIRTCYIVRNPDKLARVMV